MPASYGSINQYHFNRIVETLLGTLNVYSKVTVIRVDLNYSDNGAFSANPLERDSPTHFVNIYNNMMKLFFASFNAKIDTQQHNFEKQGKRVYPCKVNYIWVKEYSQNGRAHYHVAILLNTKSYYHLGDYNYPDSLAWKIREAWSSALNLDMEFCDGLVHFPQNPVYVLNSNASPKEYNDQVTEVLIRLGYLCKDRTKSSGDGAHCFECSNPQKGLI